MKISLRKYVKINYICILSSAILFLLYFIPYLGSTYIGIDSHGAINNPGTSYNWLSIGRQGAVLLNKLLPSAQFSLFFVQTAAYIAYIAALIGFGYLFNNLCSIPAWKSSVFFLIFMVHPIWTEQFYFSLQIYNVAVGVFLLPITLYFSYKKEKIFLPISILLQVLLFSIYQSFIICYISACISVFILIYFKNNEESSEYQDFQFFKLGIRQVVLFVVAFLINNIGTSVIFGNNEYLANAVAWKSSSASECIARIFDFVLRLMTGEGIFYCYTFSASLILIVIAVIFYIYSKKYAKEKWVLVIATLILQFTPFIMVIYGGQAPVFRSQFMLPLVTSCNVLVFLVFMDFKIKNKRIKNIFTTFIALLVFHMVFVQYYAASQLQYSTCITMKEDERRAFAIEQEIIKKTSAITKPVAFIGYNYSRINGAFVQGEAGTMSIFQHGWWSVPRYLDVNSWIIDYMKSLGINIIGASEDQIIEARNIAKNMQVFPRDGSIKDVGDYIVVKLSTDDNYATEAMTPRVSDERELTEIVFDNTLHGEIESVNIIDGVLNVNGWVLKSLYDSNYVIPEVCLFDLSSNKIYVLESGTQYRPDLTSYFNENTDYSHSGVLAKAPIEQLQQNLEYCKILLSVTTNGGTSYFDTGKFITDYIS